LRNDVIDRRHRGVISVRPIRQNKSHVRVQKKRITPVSLACKRARLKLFDGKGSNRKSLGLQRTGAEMWLVTFTLCDSANRGPDLSEIPGCYHSRAYGRAALPHGDAMVPACGISPPILPASVFPMRFYVSS
jgi:hypothetical protein